MDGRLRVVLVVSVILSVNVRSSHLMLSIGKYYRTPVRLRTCMDLPPRFRLCRYFDVEIRSF